MKKTEIVLIAALFCLVNLPYSGIAQTTPIFSAPVDTARSSSRYVASIRVSQFKKIVGAQFTIAWDATVLAFDSVGQFGLPLSPANNFGSQAVSEGILRFAWSEEALRGTDMKDGATLFSIFFRPIGPVNAMSQIRFIDTPTAMEVVDISFSAIKAEFKNGSVVIGQNVATSVQSNQPDWLDIRSAFPNPMHDAASLLVEYYSKSTQPVLLRIVDAQGKTCFEQQKEASAGINRFELSSDRFPAAGVYFIRLNQGDRFSTQKILFR